jgi:predicted DNA-binding transcriptional regulator AlpA
MTATEAAQITSDLLDETKAAQYCHLSKKTLQAWRSAKHENQPSFIKLGRRVFYRPSDLEAWIVSNTHHSPVTTGRVL